MTPWFSFNQHRTAPQRFKRWENLVVTTAATTAPRAASKNSTTNEKLTTDISLPAARRKALVHLDFLGFLFRVKFLWHFDRQNRKTCV